MLKAEISVRAIGRGKDLPTYDLKSDLQGQQTLEGFFAYIRAVLISTADAVLKDEQRQGFTKNPIVFVDNRRNKPIQNVNPIGKIEFVDPAKFSDTEILIKTMQQIIDLSPILEGEYIASHVVAYNGAIVATDVASLTAWLKTNPRIVPGDTIRFLNVAPYARKLERLGVTNKGSSRRYTKSQDKRKRSGDKVLTPNGVYFRVFRSVRRLYKRVRQIQFSFVPGSSLGNFNGRNVGAARFTSRANLRGRKEQAAGIGQTYLYPSITIRL
jgi:hypothetical protein